jgi:hypothetical protein
MMQRSLVGPADPRWHAVNVPVRPAAVPAAAVPGRWARPARLLCWTRSDRARLVAFEVVSGHVGARYLLSEATRVVEDGAPRHAGRLAHAAASWASALESLSRGSASRRLPGAFRTELAHLAQVARRVQAAAEDLHSAAPTPARRVRLLVAVDGYAGGVHAFWDRHAASLSRLRGAA